MSTNEEPLLEPLGAKVLVLADELPEETSGGIAVPQVSGSPYGDAYFLAKQKICTGTVLATGDHCQHVSVGDRVLYSSIDYTALSDLTGFPRDTRQILVMEGQILGRVSFARVSL